MPGFIARKLCPELIFVPTDFQKYTYYSDLTRKGQAFGFLASAFTVVLELKIFVSIANFFNSSSWFLLVFQKYDSNFMAASLDEAYLDVTDVCKEKGVTGEEV